MEIRLAETHDIALVTHIVQQTIREQYPHYYPPGAVTLFLEGHNEAQIGADVAKGIVYLCLDDDQAVGTITIDDNHLTRLYVRPDHQGHGYGRALLDFAEAKVAQQHDTARLETTPLGRAIYRKRGYVETEYHLMWAPNGDLLTYDDMEKKLH
ncbi:MAG: GNAT family N-acetyltransferase [Peptococcaceae bacterium]|nr:GNAT family N-acetyltransferase [Peptococcaceae bacterium]